MSRLISDEKIEAALHFLATSSEEIAAARAMRLRAEFRRKRMRAQLVCIAEETTAAARDAWAESHPKYAEVCEDECKAVERDEYLRDRRNTADTIVEAWRSEGAALRAGSNFR